MLYHCAIKYCFFILYGYLLKIYTTVVPHTSEALAPHAGYILMARVLGIDLRSIAILTRIMNENERMNKNTVV